MKIADNYICLDIETTGIGANTETIEIAAVKVRDGEIIDTFEELIKPKRTISKQITALTGISNEDVKDCRSVESVIPDFIMFIRDDILVGHNIKCFDFPIISGEAERITGLVLCNECIDTLELSREISLKSHSLAQMCDYYGIENKNAHRAMSDVIATNELFQKLIHNERNENYVERPVEQNKLNLFRFSYNKQTTAIRELLDLLKSALNDNKVDSEEVLAIKKWLDDNSNLKGSFPFDIINYEIAIAMKDNVIEPRELDHLCNVFLYAVDPIHNPSPVTVTNQNSKPPLYGSKICLTGEFVQGSRADIEEIVENSGAILCNTITKKLNYLVVGSYGSESWGEGNYGGKIKKALEYQKAGVPIYIITEVAFFEMLNEEEEAEQFTLDGFENISDLHKELNNIVQLARNKYGYYKIHKSGAFEMERDPNLKPDDMIEILEITTNKAADTYTLKIFGQIAIKIETKKGFILHISEDAYNHLVLQGDISKSTLKKFIKMPLACHDTLLAYIRNCLDYAIDNYIPVARFGCCSRYTECSIAKKCIHENKFYAKGCSYRTNLESGNIFY